MLTLAQTGKTVRVPVVLVGTAHWSGPVDWIGQYVAATGMITDVDAGRLQLTDGPAQVVDWVRRAWQIQPRSLPGPVAPRPPAGGHQWPHTCRKDGRVNHKSCRVRQTRNGRGSRHRAAAGLVEHGAGCDRHRGRARSAGVHDVGLLAGTAVIAGTGGTIVFGIVGLAASIPLLLRLRRRFGSWWAPAIGLAVFAGLFSLSAFVIGPAISGDPGQHPSEQPKPDAAQHTEHHG